MKNRHSFRLIISALLMAVFCWEVVAASSQQNSASRPLVTSGQKVVFFHTTMGDFKIRLFDDTPHHRDNFLKLVSEGYYDGMLFHRVIRDFMAQTGDPLSKDSTYTGLLGNGGPDYDLPAEILFPRHCHFRGAVGAAREGDEDNPERRSNGSQFYVVWGTQVSEKEMKAVKKRVARTLGKNFYTPEIMARYAELGGTPHLDGTYTVFGEVVEGLDVIGRIVETETDGYDQPVEPVRIIRATVVP